MTNARTNLYGSRMGSSRPSTPPEPEKNPTANNIIRVLMLFLVAIAMMWNAMGQVDPDLWVPFVCIIAVMGIGTRGAPVETIGFVMAEAIVVVFFGIAVFASSREFIWAGSLGVSMLAIAKMGYLEIAKRDVDGIAQRAAKPAAVAKPVTEPVAAAEPVAAVKPVTEPVAVAEPVAEPVAVAVAEAVTEPVAEAAAAPEAEADDKA